MPELSLEILHYACFVNDATAEAFAAFRPFLVAVAAGRPLTVQQACLLVAACDHIIAKAREQRAVLERYGCALSDVPTSRVM